MNPPSIDIRGIAPNVLHAKNDCPYKAKCGGCMDSDEEYIDEARKKTEYVAGLMPKNCSAHMTVLCEDPFNYRNKVHSGFFMTPSGDIICGPYEPGSHRIVRVEECMIENKEAFGIVRDVRDLAKKFKVKIYNEKNGTGQLRRILVRTADGTGQIMVVLITGSEFLKSKKAFIGAIRQLHPEITTILTNVNTRTDSMILGRESRIEYGKGYITDILLGMKFRIGPDTFFQVNRAQAERLYSTAIRMGNIGPEDKVLDAYCGIGTTTLSFAKIAGSVTGVEINRSSVQEARHNASANGFSNAKFVCADATDFMKEEASRGTSYDVVVLDPPRQGTTRTFIRAVNDISPDRVVYISCNPQTLARDLTEFEKCGYDAKEYTVVDMFPWTESVECAVLLKRRISG